MRNKIQRRKDFVARCKLRRKHPGLYKLVSDYGYGDGSTLELPLPIDQAMKAYCGHKRMPITGPAELLKNPSSVMLAMDSSCIYYLVPDYQVMRWEEPDFDPGDI